MRQFYIRVPSERTQRIDLGLQLKSAGYDVAVIDNQDCMNRSVVWVFSDDLKILAWSQCLDYGVKMGCAEMTIPATLSKSFVAGRIWSPRKYKLPDIDHDHSDEPTPVRSEKERMHDFFFNSDPNREPSW